MVPPINRINVAFCFNDAYCDKAAVALTSLLVNNCDVAFTIYIFSSDLSDNGIDRLNLLKRVYNNFTLHIVRVDQTRFCKLNSKIDYISIETCYRFLIAELLPNVDRILYLDGDLIINGRVDDFYDIILDNYCIAAVRDTFVMDVRGSKYLQSVGVTNYINSGVLLMNLSLMRKLKICDKFFAIGQRPEFDYLDQDIINVACNRMIKVVDQTYNCTTCDRASISLKEQLNAAIIHYTGANKPWDGYDDIIWQVYNRIWKVCSSHSHLILTRLMVAKIVSTLTLSIPIFLYFTFHKERDSQYSTYYLFCIPVYKHLKKIYRK